MAKGNNAVYRVTDVIGTSPNSWEEAARNAVKTAAKSLRDLRIAEVTKLDVKDEDRKITQFRTRLSLSCNYSERAAATAFRTANQDPRAREIDACTCCCA
jgi:flavin-binding protein dodecin